MLVFVQPFGLHSAGGGPRILRMLLEQAPCPTLSICTAPTAAPPTSVAPELHLPMRRYYGRIEHSRLGSWLGWADLAACQTFKDRLVALLLERQATAVHALAHSIDFWPAYLAAQALELPFYLSVHDDLGYALQGRPERQIALGNLAIAWQGACERFVISQPMGEEYCRRYGKRTYRIVADGVAQTAAIPLPPTSRRIYFMGSVHRSYEPNFRSLLKAVRSLRSVDPEVETAFICRGGIPFPIDDGQEIFKQLPWASEAEVAGDLQKVDFLYIPLPFASSYRDFVRYSLSTKLITYLGSGRPILFHGPKDSAAFQLLKEHDAAILVDQPEPQAICEALVSPQSRANQVATNALRLANSQFKLAEQKEKFWSAFGSLVRV